MEGACERNFSEMSVLKIIGVTLSLFRDILEGVEKSRGNNKTVKRNKSKNGEGKILRR